MFGSGPMRLVPAAIALLTVVASAARSAEPVLPLTSEAASAIDRYVATQMEASRVPGLALGVIAANGKVYLKGYGSSGRGRSPVTPQTPFIIGSVSKSFTALAVMQLADRGLVDLDAPVTRYLPWFRALLGNRPAPITVRHLLNQTSGLPPYYDNTAGAEVTIEQLTRGQLNNLPLGRHPGDRFGYSNANYILLGAIVESAAGMAYGDYVRTHIFQPLAMNHSHVSKSEAMADNLAAGCRMWFGFPVEADLPYFKSSLPAGYIVSTAEDMTRYLGVFMNGGTSCGRSILSAGAVAAMLKPAVKAWVPIGAPGTQSCYGMGWVVNVVGDRIDAVEHKGETANYHAHALMRPAEGIGVIVLDNLSGLATAGQIAPGVADLVLGKPPRKLPLTPQRIVLAFDLIASISAFLLAVAFIRLRGFRMRFRRSSLRRAAGVIFLLLVDIALPALIIFGFPAFCGAPWKPIIYFTPDLALTLLCVAGLLLVIGVAKVVLLASPSR